MKKRIKGAKLANRRSPDWAFMEKFVVPDYSHPETDDDYLTRIRLIQTPLFGIYLHKMETADPRPVLHSHPWPFLAVVLRGGYDEMRRDSHTVSTKMTTHKGGVVGGDMFPYLYAYPHRVRHLNVMPFDALHWIDKLHRVPTWTLVFVGRRTRIWQYMDRDGTLTDFDKHKFNDQFLDALKQRKARQEGRAVSDLTPEEVTDLNRWDKKGMAEAGDA